MEEGGYKVIYADPPWPYVDKMKGHSFSLDHEYPTQSLEWICSLGGAVQGMAHKDAVLFLWATSPNLPMAFDVIKAWGFKFKTVAFCWSKRTKHGKEVANLGRWTMGNVEMVLLGTRGKPKRITKNIRQLVVAERRKHSQKPDEVYERIVQLMGDVPRLEMFARQKIEGWHSWGNEVKNDIEI